MPDTKFILSRNGPALYDVWLCERVDGEWSQRERWATLIRTEAQARRLAACLNATAKYSTEFIEANEWRPLRRRECLAKPVRR